MSETYHVLTAVKHDGGAETVLVHESEMEDGTMPSDFFSFATIDLDSARDEGTVTVIGTASMHMDTVYRSDY